MRPYYEDATVTVHHQPSDGFSVLASLSNASIDAVVTDPPYGLEFMGKEWDAPWKASSVGRGVRVAQERAAEMTEQGKGHSTAAGPHLASRVDSVRVAGKPFQDWCEVWATECLRVLKPGGHMLAFGGTRTWHRLACAVEDAGNHRTTAELDHYLRKVGVIHPGPLPGSHDYHRQIRHTDTPSLRSAHV